MRPAGRKRTRVFVNITATCERRSPETDRFNGASTPNGPPTRNGWAGVAGPRYSRAKAPDTSRDAARLVRSPQMPNDVEVYETSTCPACTRLNLMEPATGNLLCIAPVVLSPRVTAAGTAPPGLFPISAGPPHRAAPCARRCPRCKRASQRLSDLAARRTAIAKADIATRCEVRCVDRASARSQRTALVSVVLVSDRCTSIEPC